MHSHAILKLARDMAGVAEACVIFGARFDHGDFGEDRDAVVALLAACDHVGIAERFEAIEGDFINRAFALLQTENIGGFFREQLEHQRFAQAHGVDVPSGECE